VQSFKCALAAKSRQERLHRQHCTSLTMRL
jgi:hypothetical protein